MAKARQRRIENRRERRQGKEITQRWLIAAHQSRRGMEDEEGWWLKNINRVQRSQAKRACRGNYIPSSDEVVVTDPPEGEKALKTKKDPIPTDGMVVTGLPGGPINKKWFEGMKDVQPRGLWLLAILTLPIIAVVTLLIGFLTAYKRISSTHP